MSKGNDDKELEVLFHKMVGALHASKMFSSFIDAAKYSLYQQIKDCKYYEKMGLDWKEFCKQYFGKTYETVNAEIKLLKEFGESFLKEAQQLRLTKRDLNALSAGLSEDARAEVKRGVIKIGDTEFKVTELDDNLEEFKANIDLLCKHKELETKEKKHLEKKLEGLEKEHKREVQAYAKENADLKALVVDPKLPEGFDALFKYVERKTDEIFMAAAKLKFEDAYGDEKTGETGRIKALYKERLTIMHNKFTNCIKRLQDSVGVDLDI